MHFIDKIICRQYKETDLENDFRFVECFLSGKSVQRIRLQIGSDKAVVLQSDDSDIKYSYKNWETHDLMLQEDMLLVKGSRMDTDSEQTFDQSGIIVYKFGKDSSKYMVTGLSKDEIFKTIGANKYQTVVAGNRLLLHGAKSNAIMQHDIVSLP